MHLEEHIDSLLEKTFASIDFPSEPSGLFDPLRYMISIGGKRLRPKLCLLAYSLFREDFSNSIVQPAVALEVFHNFTLIHDDIMDRSPLRRGMETVWKKWGEDSGVLSGDAMCIDSYRRMAMAPKAVLPEVLDLFTDTAMKVCEGQQLDMDFESAREIPMQDYIKMIGLKTGVLIACAAKLGALIAGASKEDCDNLYLYGYNIGLAFQICDDYLDAYGEAKTLGKPIGGDICNDKKCWLTTRSLEKASPEVKSSLADALSMPCGTDEERAAKIAAVKGFYDTLSIPDEANSEILRYNDIALGYASKAASGVRLERLRRFADGLVRRQR